MNDTPLYSTALPDLIVGVAGFVCIFFSFDFALSFGSRVSVYLVGTGMDGSTKELL